MDVREKTESEKRLIDANKLLMNVVAVSNSKGQVTWSAVPVMNIITTPTVDAVEVVRCRDCKHAYINSFSAASGVALCRLLTERADGIQIVMQQDDFCSYGERKEGDD